MNVAPHQIFGRSRPIRGVVDRIRLNPDPNNLLVGKLLRRVRRERTNLVRPGPCLTRLDDFVIERPSCRREINHFGIRTFS